MTNTQTMSGRAYAITGGAGGIGLAVAIGLASRGAALALADIKAEELQKAQKKIAETHPESSLAIAVVDITKRAQVDEWILSTKETFGRIDGCVNAAGLMGTVADIPNVTEEALDSILDVNLKGTFNCLRAQIPSVANGASIVNVVSMAGLTAVPYLSPYCVSKHALIGLTKTAAKENAARGIRVNAVCPGMTETPMLSEFLSIAGQGLSVEDVTSRQLFKRPAKVEEVAAMILFLLSDESAFITGENHPVSGGWDL